LGKFRSKDDKEKMSKSAKKRSKTLEYKNKFKERITKSEKLKQYHIKRKQTRVKIKCRICNKVFEVKKSRGNVAKFCSKICSNKYIAQSRLGKSRPEISGDKNHNWNNGSSFIAYPPEFSRALKNKIIKRDNNCCKNCGLLQTQLNRKLTIHHIDIINLIMMKII